jgi:hypothetical protein
MPTQSRVPGAASSEVDFELERFERTREDRIEISGRWYGLRGRRFVRPVLNLHTVGGSRRRAIALLEHKPWAADDGETWLAAFAWPPGAGDIEGAELEVGPGLVVDLPAPGGKPGSQGRVSALRPHAPAPMARRIAQAEDEEGTAEPVAPEAGDAGPERQGARVRAARPVEIWDTAPVRERPLAPPRDVRTAALDERDEAVAERDEAERERVRALNERDDALSRRDAAVRDTDRAVAERDEIVAERDRLAAELERVTRERDVADAERKRMMQDAEAVARERDQAAAERDAARSELSRALPERDQALREVEAATARADRAESERDTAFAERKTAVAQRDRARRERDRAMRAAGVEPPVESPFVGSEAAAAAESGVVPASASPPRSAPSAGSAQAATRQAAHGGDTPAASAAAPPGTPLPSRPIKRIGSAPIGATPEPKPLLTPVDSGRPRRLSRSRRPPSAPARWAVRISAMLVLIAVLVVLAILLATVL